MPAPFLNKRISIMSRILINIIFKHLGKLLHYHFYTLVLVIYFGNRYRRFNNQPGA